MPYLPVVLAASIAASFMDGRDGEFPTETIVRSHMNALQRDFRSADSDDDCWMGFLPLLNAVVQHQDEERYDVMAAVERAVLENFTIYVFAGELEYKMAKADFGGRQKCLNIISQFSVVRCDTNALFKVADYLSGAVLLPVDKDVELKEMLNADALDSKLIFGQNTPPRMYGDLTFVSVAGKFGRECREKFRFRRLYNERLPKFRVAALSAMRGAVMNGYKDRTAEERDSIWDEFCRRAKATAEERKQAEE